MQTTTLESNFTAEIEALGNQLCQSISRGNFEEAQELLQRCAALHSAENHAEVLAIIERARQNALVRKSMVAACLVDLQRSSQYESAGNRSTHSLAQG